MSNPCESRWRASPPQEHDPLGDDSSLEEARGQSAGPLFASGSSAISTPLVGLVAGASSVTDELHADVQRSCGCRAWGPHGARPPPGRTACALGVGPSLTFSDRNVAGSARLSRICSDACRGHQSRTGGTVSTRATGTAVVRDLITSSDELRAARNSNVKSTPSHLQSY